MDSYNPDYRAENSIFTDPSIALARPAVRRVDGLRDRQCPIGVFLGDHHLDEAPARRVADRAGLGFANHEGAHAHGFKRALDAVGAGHRLGAIDDLHDFSTRRGSGEGAMMRRPSAQCP